MTDRMVKESSAWYVAWTFMWITFFIGYSIGWHVGEFDGKRTILEERLKND